MERYAARFDAAEINSTFKRTHRATTYERWASLTPDGFSFSVKVPKAITHDARLRDCEPRIEAFTHEIAGLGPRLGPLLLQLPPSLPFDPDTVARAAEHLTAGGLALVCEPRHVSWFTPEVDAWLAERRIARVAADPTRHPGSGEPGGWRGLTYYRWHGSPRVYYSSYGATALTELANRLRRSPSPETWCVFDNTASGAAAANALTLQSLSQEP